MPPAAATFPPPEDPKLGWYPDTMALPSCPCTSVYMPCRCYNPEQVSVCQVNGETYRKGTIMQTNKIMDQLCPKKSGSACWQYDPGYRANSSLDPHLYQVLNTTHHLLNDTNPQLARNCWFCLSLGAPWYLATSVPLNNATAMGTPTDPPLKGPVLRAIELTLKAPECFTNNGGTEPVGNLARDKSYQTLKGEWPTYPPTSTLWFHPHQGLFFVCGTDAYLCLPFSWMCICTLALLTPQMNIVPNNQTLTVPLAGHTQSKRVMQFILLLVGLGIMAGIGMGIGGTASSTTFYHTLSKTSQMTLRKSPIL